MQPLIIIPARGGSKGLPGKNIKILNGKPMINYTIEAAMEVFPKERIIVTTDSEEIKAVSEECGLNVPFLRPEHLSSDTASTYDVILHAMEFATSTGLEFDAVVLLQPTSPLRDASHIRGALELYDPTVDMVVSVVETGSNPYYSLFEENDSGFLVKCKEGKYNRRQDCPAVFEYNGAIYIINAESVRKSTLKDFSKIRKYVMPKEASLDIDTEVDWLFTEIMLKRRAHN